MHDGFKVNEPVCIVKFEQQYVITIVKVFENEPKNISSLHVSFILTHLMIVAPF